MATMKPDRFTANARFLEFASRLVSNLLVALMLACAAASLVSLAGRINPAWQKWYLVGLAFFAALDHQYTRPHLRRYSTFSRPWFVLAITEWAVLFLITRLVVAFYGDLPAFFLSIPTWHKNFLGVVLTPEFVTAAWIVVIVWNISGGFAELLDELTLDQSLLRDEIPSVFSGKAPMRSRMLGLVFGTGILCVIMTSLARTDIRNILSTPTMHTPAVSAFDGGGLSSILYFVFSIALLSQTQFFELQYQWASQKVPVSRELVLRWIRYSLIFLLGVALFVAFIPTSFSLGFLDVMAQFLSVLAGWMSFISQLLLGLLFLLLSLPSLFGSGKPPAVASTPPPATPTPIPQTPLAPIAESSSVETLKMLIFWAILCVVIWFVVRQFWGEHNDALRTLRKVPVLRWLGDFWRWLRGLTRQVVQGLETVVQNSLQWFTRDGRSANSGSSSGFLNLRRLSPRQKVYFFYLALVRRGTETGLPRNASQTPSEYAAALDSALPDADQDVNALTEAFMTARYTKQEIEPEKASLAQRYWERIKKSLRRPPAKR